MLASSTPQNALIIKEFLDSIKFNLLFSSMIMSMKSVAMLLLFNASVLMINTE